MFYNEVSAASHTVPVNLGLQIVEHLVEYWLYRMELCVRVITPGRAPRLYAHCILTGMDTAVFPKGQTVMPSQEKTGDEHVLASLTSLSPESIDSLAKRWITSVEQIIALCATEDGRKGIMQILGTDSTGLASLLREAEAMVGEEKAKNLRQAHAGGARGVILTEEEKRKYGRE